jgi:hypothetical protein
VERPYHETIGRSIAVHPNNLTTGWKNKAALRGRFAFQVDAPA